MDRSIGDLEFDEALEHLVKILYGLYSEALEETYHVHESAEFNRDFCKPDLRNNEKFFWLNREDMHTFFIRECGYQHFGTGVWHQLPTSEDVKKFFDAYLESFMPKKEGE